MVGPGFQWFQSTVSRIHFFSQDRHVRNGMVKESHPPVTTRKHREPEESTQGQDILFRVISPVTQYLQVGPLS